MAAELLTSTDLMALLKISEATLWRKVKRGLIPMPVKICGLTRWREREIIAAIECQQCRNQKPTPRNRLRAVSGLPKNENGVFGSSVKPGG